MQEYSVELSDIRWYLAMKTAERLLTYHEDVKGLTKLIWSGRLEADLYNLEEAFVEEQQDRLDRSLADEARIRELFSEILAARSKRYD
jgi:hypothetical protein